MRYIIATLSQSVSVFITILIECQPIFIHNNVTLDTTYHILYDRYYTDRPTMTATTRSSSNEDWLTIDGIQKHNSEIIGFEKIRKAI